MKLIILKGYPLDKDIVQSVHPSIKKYIVPYFSKYGLYTYIFTYSGSKDKSSGLEEWNFSLEGNLLI